MLHGLGENRSDETNALGMSINTVAETQLAPQGYAVLTLDARGHGQSEGLVGVDGPREIQDVRELVAWLTSQPAIHPGRIGAFGYSYGGGAVWRAAAEGVPFAAIEVATTWTDLYSALAPQELARSGVVLGFWNSIAARAAPEVGSVVNDVLAGRNLAAVRAFAAARSTRQLLGQIKAPTFLLQGRRDFAFDLEQALVPLRASRFRSGSTSATSGTPRLRSPRASSRRPPRRTPLVRQVPEGPPERDRQRAAGRGCTRSLDRPHVLVPIASGSQDAATHLSGRREIGSTGKFVRTLPRRKARLETSALRCSASRWRAERMAPRRRGPVGGFTPQGREIVDLPSGGARSASARPRQVSIRLISQLTSVPPRSRLRLTIGATSTAQSPGNLLYLSGVPRSARLVVGPARMTLPVLARPSRAERTLGFPPVGEARLTPESTGLLTQSCDFRLIR